MQFIPVRRLPNQSCQTPSQSPWLALRPAARSFINPVTGIWSPHQMKKSRRRSPSAVLHLPDLKHAKSAVQQPSVAGIPAFLRVCDPELRALVLLRTATRPN